MPRSMKGWRKKWFYLMNDTSAPLPVFIGCHPVPQPSWGDRVAWKNLNKLQPLHEALQQLWPQPVSPHLRVRWCERRS
jgi:hypothetical protein